MKVYLLQGWFGDIEWLEGVYASQEKAEAEATRLRKTRTTEKPVPDWVQGLCKFGIDEMEVIE